MTGRQVFAFDLAAELGMTLRDLKQRMSEREFAAWARYATQRGGTPLQRIEFHLMRLCMFIEVGLLGKKNGQLSEYMLGEKPPVRGAVIDMTIPGAIVHKRRRA